MTQPSLRKELEQLRARLEPEKPVLVTQMAYGDSVDAVLAADRAKYPGVEFGLAVVTRVWGAPVRPELAEHPSA